jgi:hypothetical protein
MYQSDTEILFPMRVAPELRNLRGRLWKELVDRVSRAPDASPEHLAFTLMIIRLSNCLSCHTHSYRALRGCTACASQSVRRFRGTDAELLALYQAAHQDVAGELVANASMADK